MINHKQNALRLAMVVSYLVMIITNMFANSKQINALSTADVAMMYTNLLTPASYTFLIWGFIYILLAVYVLLHFKAFYTNDRYSTIIQTIAPYFIVSCLANALWLVAWHYEYLIISLFLLLIILFCLVQMTKISKNEMLYMRITIGVYLAWIIIASIANVTAVLVSISFNAFFENQIWVNIVLVFGAIIVTLLSLKFKTIVYLLVFIWAYVGILVEHTSISGWNQLYPSIIITASVLVTAFIGLIVYVGLAKLKIVKQRKLIET